MNEPKLIADLKGVMVLAKLKPEECQVVEVESLRRLVLASTARVGVPIEGVANCKK